MASTRVMRVLFIGNSYTFCNDMPLTVARLAAAAGAGEIEPALVAPGGWTLEKHWEDGTALARIREGGWSHVVLQEHSLRPILEPEQTLAFGRRFGQEIASVGAAPVVYLTWARQHRPETQDTLDATYTRLAKEVRAVVAPVGPAWQAILRDRPDLQLHLEDQSHPTPLGSYAAAAVLFATLTGCDPQPADVLDVSDGHGDAARPIRLDPDTARLVRRIAGETVRAWRARS